MAFNPDSTGRRRKKHRWIGVVEDFVDLKLEDHSYECILKHTENLLQKTKAAYGSEQTMINKGVLPPLVDLVGFHDLRDNGKLQHTAIKILKVLTCAADSSMYESLASANLIMSLMKLLKLEQEALAFDIFTLIDFIQALDEDPLNEVPMPWQQCMEGLIRATHYCSKASLRRSALELIMIVLNAEIPPPERIQQYVRDLNHLLNDEDPDTVSKICAAYALIAMNGSPEITLAITSTGFLERFSVILMKAQTDATFAQCAPDVLLCTRALARKTPKHVPEIIHSGMLHYLSHYLISDSSSTKAQANWIAAYVIGYSDDNVTTEMVNSNQVPSLTRMFPEGVVVERKTVAKLLTRLLQNGTFLTHYLNECLIDYLENLETVGHYAELKDVLEVFTEALREVKNQGKLAGMKDAMPCVIQQMLELQECPNDSIRILAKNVVEMCLAD